MTRRGGYCRFLSFCITLFSCCCLKSVSFLVRVLSDRASICTASMAAFFAPAFPIATVATGTPGGICTVLNSASRPAIPSFAAMGTPMTGSMVLPAIEPAR